MGITYDSYATATALTVAHTIVASGNNRILIAIYQTSGATSEATEITECKYDGVDADGTVFIYGGSGVYTALCGFYWLESSLPSAAGTYNCVATAPSGTWSKSVITSSYKGCKQEAPSMASIASTVSQATTSLNITTGAADSLIVDAAGVYSSNVTTITPTAGQTKIAQGETASNRHFAVGYEVEATAQQYSRTWSFASSGFWQMVAFAVKPVSDVITSGYTMLDCNF